MGVERIGLEAVLERSDFQTGMMQYLAGINKMTGETKRVASRISSDFVNLGQGVLKFGAIAGGAALLGVGALTAGIVALGGTALNEYAKFERLSLSVQSLVARELSQGQLVEQQRQVVAQLTKKEADELENLHDKIIEETAARDTLNARIQEQRQRVIEMTTQWTEQGLATQTAKARLAEMELQYRQSGEAIAEMQGRVEELNARNGELVTVIEKVRVGQMDMSDAMAQASPRAQELLKWIQLLAVQSPFDQEGVAVAFRTALAYGFTSEEAQRLTEAQIDFASATGQGVEVMNLIALALGQMQAKGKVSGQELIQLTNAGIGVNKILGDMGVTLDDVSNGLVDSGDFIEAVIRDMEVFKGSAKEQSSTFSGLLNSLSDLKAIGLREFFTGTFQAIQPYLVTFVDMLTEAGLQSGRIREIGDVLGGVVAGGLERIGGLVTAFQAGGAGGLLAALGITPEAVTLFNLIRDSVGGLAEIVSGQLTPAMGDFQGIIPTLNAGIEFAVAHFDELQGALIGIGAVLAVGVFAALVAGLLSLLTPVNLIIAGAALLGAAWAGNWGNIQGITATALGLIQTKFGEFSAFWQANWPMIQAVALTALAVLQSVWAGIMSGLQPAIANIQSAFTTVTDAFSSLGISWGGIGNALLQATGIVFAAIGAIILGAISIIVGLVGAVASTVSAIISWWQMLSTTSTQFVTGIIQLFSGDFAGGLTNIFQGLINTISAVFVGGLMVLLAPIQGFIDSVIGFWQGLFDTLVGGSIVPDLINSIVSWFTMLPDAILGALGGLTEAIGNIFSGLFGGGEAAAPAFDTAAMQQGLQLVQALITQITTVDLPMMLTAATITAAGIVAQLLLVQTGLTQIDLLLTTIATLTLVNLLVATTVTAVGMITQIILVQNAVMQLDMMIVAMTTVTLPALLTAATVTGAGMVTAIVAVQGAVSTLDSLIVATTASIETMGNTTKDAMKKATEGFKKAEDALGDLIDKVKEAEEAFHKMADAAREAAKASREAGSSSEGSTGQGFSQGVGFQTGTLGWTVPEGYPNDSFQIQVSSGEELLIAPRGQSIESILMDRLGGGRMMETYAPVSKTVIVDIGDVYIYNDTDVDDLERRIVRAVEDEF